MRLNVFLQQAGVGSRREAERLIATGAVTCNGQPATATQPVTVTDDVRVHGQPVTPSQAPVPRLFALHKPLDVLVTAKDPQNRPTIYHLPSLNTPGLPRLVPVGRLDVNSEGLLLLTTSGTLAQQLMHPRSRVPRVYRVRVFGHLTPAHIQAIAQGVTVQGVAYQGATVTPSTSPQGTEPPSPSAKNQWYQITLTEGKNREVRKLFAHFGLTVNRLIRTSYGPCQLGTLPKGHLQEIPPAQVQTLLTTLPPLPKKSS